MGGNVKESSVNNDHRSPARIPVPYLGGLKQKNELESIKMQNRNNTDDNKHVRNNTGDKAHSRNKTGDNASIRNSFKGIFKRSRSKVFFESDVTVGWHFGKDGESKKSEDNQSKDIKNDTGIKWVHNNLVSNAQDLYNINEAHERSSGEDSPGSGSQNNSFRIVRGSPSHKSQDSGFSDSGDSNSGTGQEPERPHNPTFQTKRHVSKVYFYSVSDIVHEPGQVNGEQFFEPHVSGEAIISSHPKHSVSTKSDGDLDDFAHILDHKPLLDDNSEFDVKKKYSSLKKQYKSTPVLLLTPGKQAFDSISRVSDKNYGPVTSTPKKRSKENVSEEQKGSTGSKARTRRRWSTIERQNIPSWLIKGSVEEPSGPKWSLSRDGASFSLHSSDGVSSHGWPMSDGQDEPGRASRYASLPCSIQKWSIKTTLQTAKNDSRSPVGYWMQELRKLYEPECTAMLQSKPVATDFPLLSAAMTGNTNDTVHAIQQRAHIISAEFAKLCQRLESRFFEQVPPLVQSLVGNTTDFLKDYNKKTRHLGREMPGLAGDKSVRRRESDAGLAAEVARQQRALLEICDQLKQCASLHQAHHTGEVVQVITALGHAFTKLVDLMLSKEVKVLLNVLEAPETDQCLQAAINSLIALGLEGTHICRLIAKHGGIRAMLGICVENKLKSVRDIALRALATVSCVIEGIQELETAGGVDILADILCDPLSGEEEKSEAAGVVAQITSPWIDDNHHIRGLSEHVESIIAALTGLAKSTTSSETFLIVSAALANLTFMEPIAVLAMKKCGTVRVLVRAVRGQTDLSVFVQDQVATTLANMAANSECRSEVIDNSGLIALLCFLQIRPSPLERSAVIAACERVQQKSAIALSRLCTDANTAQLVVEMQGMQRLVQLCKDDRERNHSDGVLVACLAALRKIAATCGLEEFQDLDATELVEPRLLDSFLIYSSRQESYV